MVELAACYLSLKSEFFKFGTAFLIRIEYNTIRKRLSSVNDQKFRNGCNRYLALSLEDILTNGIIKFSIQIKETFFI
ncbi:MAG: hypothetical protein COW84_02580 [Gammaproteobacteria bacterium CG22_combo_CG10-13_8_21_14_all_40_8]|nr:MAG: hypothetical protein COW84_02580 [Gammaproteobacteria bacterium CG22_combo_CG10-13_8_21_14_all_40_8]